MSDGHSSLQLPTLDNFYARWREREVIGSTLRERPDATPPEMLLQAVWQHQRLLRDQLQTLDARPVRILHPGFKNHEAGPDFRSAMVQIGSEPPVSGDIEIDLEPSGWHAHGHASNANFKNVILHVLWDGERAANNLPTIVLRGKLDAPLAELDSTLGRDALTSLPENFRGKCCAPLRELSPENLTTLLHQAAQVRWQSKAAQLQARARQAGWEQALWEGIFRALGYKQKHSIAHNIVLLAFVNKSAWLYSTSSPNLIDFHSVHSKFHNKLLNNTRHIRIPPKLNALSKLPFLNSKPPVWPTTIKKHILFGNGQKISQH